MVRRTIDTEGLKAALGTARRLVIILHDNPDPDAIAAGWLLQTIAENLGTEAVMVHGGDLGRAENQAMVRLLDIPLHRLDDSEVALGKRDRLALVDTQPGTGNNSLPEHLDAHLVIDHHPSREGLRAEFVDIRQDDGCTATLLLAYYRAFGLEVTSALATAVLYAILSETQDLEREATRADRDACQFVFPLVQLTTLGKIRHPTREREYFRTIARAMQHVMVGRNTCICHIGQVRRLEMVAEVADLLVKMNQVSWCLVSGFRPERMVLSIRTTHQNARADKVMIHVLRNLGKGGGHDMIAGGSAPCSDNETYESLCSTISNRFLGKLPRKKPDQLHPLLDELRTKSGEES